ncbi:MAG: hypothetical protein PWR12_2021 [Eubacteriaceae bacterium]|jgi:hypothetical protein|nr:hypothetical protein [Eubacteriaceae bacterium]MDK2905943.1 hypothetical protein [Eubacteriaceae bacterium]MDK2937253.1 hypothetical protein [Eubacteriaceae bacterium]MDK2962351.1 hypothetical protein [Eubacteriaceae bacterium]
MEKMRIVEMIREKIDAAGFNDKGLASISVNEMGDSDQILGAIEVLKSETPFEFDFDVDAMVIKVYNKEEDLDGFIKRNPSPQKCQ